MIEHMFDMSEGALVKRITELEHRKSAAAAEQARLTAALDAKRRAREADAGVPTAKRGKGLAAEVALARQDSPNRGGRHLGFARALVYEMPHTLAALEAGLLSEWRATLIVRESACLTVADRRTLDTEICSNQSGLSGMGDKRIAAEAKAIAYRLDPQAIVDRAVRAEAEANVSIRPAPDTMAYVTALLPMKQGVAVYATLKRCADTTFDGRGRGKVMADTMFERITGRAADVPVPISVNLVISDETLFGGDDVPGRVPGYGPIPAAIACRLAADGVGDERSRATLRRLYRHPVGGGLVAMESRSRIFPKGLARFIAMRDDTCRTPYCDAPIRHTDHANSHAAGGPTSELNGLGECEACNYAKEAPGWRVSTERGRDGTHTSEFTTPTGARHRSKAPPLPGRDRLRSSNIEVAFADVLAWRGAA